MSTIIRVKGVDWSDKGFPNISPFVARSDLEFGYDLAARISLLSDISGNEHTLTPYKNDITAGIHGIDPAINVGIDDGQGVRVELGYLLNSKPISSIPINGSVQFTVMVFGGKSPVAFPPDKVSGSPPARAGLFDYGSRVTPNGLSIEATDSSAEVRIKSSSPRLTVAASPGGRSLIFLTYDGDRWTLRNGVTGESDSKTNADMGITAPIALTANPLPGAAIGHTHGSSTLNAFYPSIYQVAMWNRPLSEAEISEQSWRALMDKPALSV